MLVGHFDALSLPIEKFLVLAGEEAPRVSRSRNISLGHFSPVPPEVMIHLFLIWFLFLFFASIEARNKGIIFFWRQKSWTRRFVAVISNAEGLSVPQEEVGSIVPPWSTIPAIKGVVGWKGTCRGQERGQPTDEGRGLRGANKNLPPYQAAGKFCGLAGFNDHLLALLGSIPPFDAPPEKITFFQTVIVTITDCSWNPGVTWCTIRCSPVTLQRSPNSLTGRSRSSKG